MINSGCSVGYAIIVPGGVPEAYSPRLAEEGLGCFGSHQHQQQSEVLQNHLHILLLTFIRYYSRFSFIPRASNSSKMLLASRKSISFTGGPLRSFIASLIKKTVKTLLKKLRAALKIHLEHVVVIVTLLPSSCLADGGCPTLDTRLKSYKNLNAK